MLARTRALLQPGAAGYPASAAIAAALHLAPRTYRRRLRETGMSYQQLREEAPREWRGLP